MTLPPRLRGRTVTNGECWLWTGSTTANGYGRCEGMGETLAHRFAYAAVYGSVPAGMELDHTCRIRSCINPLHLEPVTTAENTRRARALVEACRNGHPYDEQNTHQAFDGTRQCRICRRERHRRHRGAKEAA